MMADQPEARRSIAVGRLTHPEGDPLMAEHLTDPPEAPRRYELHLTSLELSMLTQALMLMLPQIERTINAATGEEVTTQSLVHTLIRAGMATHAREDFQADLDAAHPPLTAEGWARLAVGDVLQHVGSGVAYRVIGPGRAGGVRLRRTLHATNPQEWRLMGRPREEEPDA